MKQVLLAALIAFVLSSCDPVAQMEANIENTTSQNLSLAFVSSQVEFNKTLQISSGETVLFQEGFDVGNTFLEPSLVEYDSVVVRNQAEEVLRVYKPSDTGKTIYGINDFWSSREPSKRIFVYEYQIENVDIQ